MCGIVGYAGFFQPGLLKRFCDAIYHRGPDNEGLVELAVEKIALGNRRLAIIDLEGGAQPYKSPDGRVHLVYNGEIYNHEDLRRVLEAKGHVFRTLCDTEVVLNAYLQWGADAWPKLQGMFAIAIADLRDSYPRLLVVRDRVGIKPLYYAAHLGRIAFASEIKPLLDWDDFSRNVDLGSVRRYLSMRYVPGPRTMFEGLRKLPAGHYLEFANGDFTLHRWWSTPNADMVESGMNAEDGSRVMEDAMRLSVRRHMIADVPVGVFLSGGIDSNAITALMAEVSSAPVHTFSIGFPDFPNDDVSRAEMAAKALGTDHQSIECRASELTALPDIAWTLDEPVGDAIVAPIYVLAREARKKVKVVLSGDGGDEVLGGYMFQRKLLQMARMKRMLPCPLLRLGGRLLNIVPLAVLERLFDYPGRLGEEGRRKVAGMLQALADEGLSDLYRRSISLFDDIDVQRATSGRQAFNARQPLPFPEPMRAGSPLQQLIDMQFEDWLPDLMLTKFDKLTMAHSLEGRVPFLDEAVITAAARIPDHLKMTGAENKKPVRDFASKLLPTEIVKSPKAAFYIPMESYVRTPEMQDLLRWTLDPVRVEKRGLFDPQWAKAALDADPNDGFLPLKRVFSLAMLELWFERYCPDASWS